ncbi:MAG TPA: ATP synthase F0 subunit C [bacterium]|nr:ATP synthase F0 subunit C [bacterium]HPQ19432.1 ATP synthase F0 subunit C [bacterium]
MEINLIVNGFKFLGAGLCMGFGAIGTSIGIGFAAGEAVKGIQRQSNASTEITKIMLIGQAVSESPAIFALVIAILMLFSPVDIPPDANLAFLITNFGLFLGAGISMGWGAFGPGIGSGWANGYACAELARNPHLNQLILRTMLIGQSVSQSTSVYALVVALLLLFVV